MFSTPNVRIYRIIIIPFALHHGYTSFKPIKHPKKDIGGSLSAGKAAGA
jgi:hypothetical protein